MSHFNETLSYGFGRTIFPYRSMDDTIHLFKDAGVFFSFKIENIENNELVLNYHVNEAFRSENRVAFQRIKRFNCKKSSRALKSLFADNTFLIENINTEITFYDYDGFKGELVVNNSRNGLNIETDHDWYLAHIHDEMFLVIGSHLIQIITAGKDEIIGYMYGENNSKIIMKKI